MEVGTTARRKLNVLLANPRGFCAGVERAVEIVERALQKFGAPVYVRHEIVHNKYVVDSLKAKGAIFVKEIDDIPENSVVIFSAHGVSLKVEEQANHRKLRTLDATCPLVTKVHNEAQRYVNQNKKLILIGHAGHPEVEGTSGRVSETVTLVQNIEDVKNLSFSAKDALSYVTQTTLSVDDTSEIIKALVAKYPAIEGPHLKDICYATQHRQEAVKSLAIHIDLLLVIGAQNSSNSNRLRDLGMNMGVRSHLINDNSDIDYNWLRDVQTVGITAGASAPEILLEQILNSLQERFDISVSTISNIEEKVKFRLPKELEEAA